MAGIEPGSQAWPKTIFIFTIFIQMQFSFKCAIFVLTFQPVLYQYIKCVIFLKNVRHSNHSYIFKQEMYL